MPDFAGGLQGEMSGDSGLGEMMRGDMAKSFTVLGIESSCDDTAAGLVRGGVGAAVLLSNCVSSQYELHGDFGGVVPELAARAHVEKLDLITQEALDTACVGLADIDAIAATAGPGLIGGVLSGLTFAKGLALATGKPLVAINHLAGHALTPRLTDGISYPYLMLLVSGGHCQFLIVHAHDRFERLGGTIDDAPGEAFDKIARLLSLGYPGGPALERAAKGGDAARFALPRPLLDREGCDMSFSGLKTAARRARDGIVEDNRIKVSDRRDLCASFQAAIVDVLIEKSRRAIDLFQHKTGASGGAFAVAGGVAANAAIGAGLRVLCDDAGLQFLAPPLSLCTDNGAMIAYAGLEMFAHGTQHDLHVSARPRWPLDQTAAAMLGSGKKGAKA